MAINHGFSKGVQMRSELTVEFEKSAATIDIAAALNKIFRAGRQGGGPTATKTRGSFGSNTSNNKQQRRLGTDNPTKAPGEPQCRFCKKYHNEPNKSGREVWATHRCKLSQ